MIKSEPGDSSNTQEYTPPPSLLISHLIKQEPDYDGFEEKCDIYESNGRTCNNLSAAMAAPNACSSSSFLNRKRDYSGNLSSAVNSHGASTSGLSAASMSMPSGSNYFLLNNSGSSNNARSSQVHPSASSRKASTTSSVKSVEGLKASQQNSIRMKALEADSVVNKSRNKSSAKSRQTGAWTAAEGGPSRMARNAGSSHKIIKQGSKAKSSRIWVPPVVSQEVAQQKRLEKNNPKARSQMRDYNNSQGRGFPGRTHADQRTSLQGSSRMGSGVPTG